MLNARKIRVHETAIRGGLWLCAAVSVLTTAGIIYVLVSESVRFFSQVSLFDFLLGAEWNPLFGEARFGVLPLLCGTLLVSVGALLVGVPIGLGTAVFLSEYAPPLVRQIAKPVLEVLAGIPSVIFGYFALAFITPQIVQRFFPTADPFNAASAAIVLGIMIIPTVASISDDALRAVPGTLRQAAYALSATKVEVTTRVVLPAAMSGVLAAILLALGRAIGETMAVTMAAGITPRLTLNPLRSVQTMTSFIVQVKGGDAAQETLAYRSLFAVGLALFLMTLLLNLISRAILAKFQERYE